MVNAKGKVLLFVGMLLLGVGACKTSAGEGTAEPGLTGESQSESNTIVAESDGLRAEATSPISVRLSWTPVDGATGYQLDGAYGDEEFLPVGSVGAGVTAVELVPILPESQMTYRVTAITASGEGSTRQVSLATPALTPNPTMVQVTVEVGQISFPGIDLENIDPETFDWSSVDPSTFDPENFDPESLLPEPTTVTQTIGPAGGRLEAVGLDGALYELIIPEGAFPMDVDISITPIASIEGMPDGAELVGAVQIDPAGLPLAAPATLVITPAEPAADSAEAMLVGIGFNGNGGDFHFLPLNQPGIAGVTGGRSVPGLASLDQQQSGGISTVVLREIQSQGVVYASPRTVVSHSQEHPTANPSSATQQSMAAGDAAQRLEDQANSSGGDSRLLPSGGPGIAAAPGGRSFPGLASSSRPYAARLPEELGVLNADDELTPLVHPDSIASWRADNIQDRIRNSTEFKDQMSALDDFEALYDKFRNKLDSDRMDALWDEVIERIIHPQLQRAANAPCLSYYHLTGLMLGERLSRPSSAFDRELVRRYIERYGAEGRELIRKAAQIAERCPLRLEVYSEITVYFNECPTERPCHLDHFVQTADTGLRLTWAGLDRADGRVYLVSSGPLEYRRLEGTTAPGCLWEVPGGVAQSPKLRVVRLGLEFAEYEGGLTLVDFVLERYNVSGGHYKMHIVNMAGRPSDECDAGAWSGAGKGDLWWTAYGAIMRPNFTLRDWHPDPGASDGVLGQVRLDHEGRSVHPAYVGGGRAEGCTIFRIVDLSGRTADGSTSPRPRLTCDQ